MSQLCGPITIRNHICAPSAMTALSEAVLKPCCPTIKPCIGKAGLLRWAAWPRSGIPHCCLDSRSPWAGEPELRPVVTGGSSYSPSPDPRTVRILIHSSSSVRAAQGSFLFPRCPRTTSQVQGRGSPRWPCTGDQNQGLRSSAPSQWPFGH